MRKKEAIQILSEYPYLIGHAVGFDRLTELHNNWILRMVYAEEDGTLQGHRGSYKTTCLSIALSMLMIIAPDKNILFLRKTDDDVKEIVRQVQKMLSSAVFIDLVNALWGRQLQLATANAFEISTNIFSSARGTSQLVAKGINGALTGKHFDYIFTDDIVNVVDRVSKAERDHTKTVYQELQNIINRSGRIFNTGTPWHKEDCFSLMPEPERWDCYSTGLISAEELAKIKRSMEASLFAANYELRHIPSDAVIFDSPITNAEPALAEQGICHVDAAYGGEDYTAFTIMCKRDGKYYVFGKLWRKAVGDVMDEIIKYRKLFNAGKIYCENNGDKGYLAKDLRSKGERVVVYHENMNKFLKITSYLKAIWEDVIFVAGTDEDYINQICDYNENAEHDDAPDSCACLARKLWAKNKDTTASDAVSMFL